MVGAVAKLTGCIQPEGVHPAWNGEGEGVGPATGHAGNLCVRLERSNLAWGDGLAVAGSTALPVLVGTPGPQVVVAGDDGCVRHATAQRLLYLPALGIDHGEAAILGKEACDIAQALDRIRLCEGLDFCFLCLVEAKLAGLLCSPRVDAEAISSVEFPRVHQAGRVRSATGDRHHRTARQRTDDAWQRNGCAGLILAEAALAKAIPSPGEEATIVRQRHGMATTAGDLHEPLVGHRAH